MTFKEYKQKLSQLGPTALLKMEKSDFYLEKLLEACKAEATSRRNECIRICSLGEETSGLNCGQYATKLWEKEWYEKFWDDPEEAERQMSRAMGGL